MSETADAGQAAERKRAEASNFLPIVRGRLPLLFVHAIRFDKVLSAMSKKDLATKFGTSVGKVFDIQKGRNFSYVTEGFKPTQDDVNAAKEWVGQVGAANAKGLNATGDRTLMQTVIDEYVARGLASAEEAAAFSAARTATRTRSEKAPKSAAVGGEAATATADAGAADDLLS